MTIVSNVKTTLTTIKGIEAQLSSLALNALDKSAQQVFHESTLALGEIKVDMQNRLAEIQFEESEYKDS